MAPTRILCRACRGRLTTSRPARAFASNATSSSEKWPQAHPIGAYYESVLRNPTPYPFEKKPEEPPKSADPSVLPSSKKADRPAETKEKPGRPSSQNKASGTSTAPYDSLSPPVPAPPPSSAEDKAKIIFNSRLNGPAERADRAAAKDAQASYVAGVRIPPRPEEPDNCCMSGCVNCVWDQYREEVEEWSAKKREAQLRMREHSASMDADGGGSETNWAPAPTIGDEKIAKDLWDEDVFKGVPVTIREFMKQEKRLKEKHEQEGSFGG